MKKKCVFIAAIALIVFALTGCTEMYALTEDEMNTIAVYSAHAISKFNKYEVKSLVTPSKIEEEEKTEEADNSQTGEGTQPEQGSSSDQNSDPTTSPQTENQNGDGSSDEPDAQNSQSGDDSAEEPPQETYVTLTEAVGIDGVEVDYKDYDVSEDITESTYFGMSAAEGKTYVIINLKVKNTTDKPKKVNIAKAMPRFKLTINDETNAMSQTTLLLSDFSTMSETVGSGKSKSKKLIFEVNKDAAKKINSLLLNVTMNDNSSTTKLL